MTRTRWKIMASGLAVSLGGLATMAGAQTQCQKADQKSAPLPVIPNPAAPIEIPTPVAVPSLPPAPAPLVSTPGDVVIPAPAATIIPASAKAAVVGGAIETAPMPREVMTAKVTELALPITIEPAIAPPPPPAKPAQPLTLAAPEAPKAEKSLPLVEIKEIKPEPVAPGARANSISLPPPAEAPPAAHTQQRVPALAADPTPPAPVQRPAAATPAERKLKVVLNMGDERPRFEVRDGEEIYLKVVCDKIDVKTTPEVGANMATMRASGRVAFVTPGGEGSCDELSVVPGAGQVVVSGKVSFKYNWGKAETVVSGERMTFRLGTTPGVTASPVAPTAVPASYQRR